METTKQLRRFGDTRKVTPDGRVYILRRKNRPSTEGADNNRTQKSKEKEVQR
jgi:hypothetical protein